LFKYHRNDRRDYNDYDSEFKTCVPIPEEFKTRNEAVEWFANNIGSTLGEDYELISISNSEIIKDEELKDIWDKKQLAEERKKYEALKKKFEGE
jgi:hypothetical protein